LSCAAWRSAFDLCSAITIAPSLILQLGGEATVKTHLSNALAKLAPGERVQALCYIDEIGLTQTRDT